ncbi:MAG: STAS-like domain-containing protein [Patescibacteria group bacterium]
MKIILNKFGTTLSSRPAGREAFLVVESLLQNLPESEKIELDFAGVAVLTPSWADEVITPLIAKYGREKVVLEPSTNASVVTTLGFWADQWDKG